MTDQRRYLLQRLSDFKTVHVHNRVETMSDEELERYVDILEKAFEDAFSKDEGDDL